ncbi:MAG: fatty acid oxidation complex subunit alpha FadB [Pseudomonadales bacterium]|nr:fatty acid oxidation complex subunit alpha FadB [Pseudomonadales bacterium]
MLLNGNSIQLEKDPEGIVHLTFDGQESVNKFDLQTTEELRQAVSILQQTEGVAGLLVKSAKPAFIVGADIKEFSALFSHSEEDIHAAVVDFNGVFADFEALPFATVALIDGICLGGGFEMALACDFRVASPAARIGLPEVKLGINPGFGGTIRLPRLIGIDNAVEWIATGKENKAAAALTAGAVDAVVASEQLEASALKLIAQANTDKLDFKARKAEKREPVMLNDMERIMAFTTAKGLVASQAGPHMPAPLTAVKSIEQSCALAIDAAIQIEAKFFARLAKTEVSRNLVALFLNEQALSKRANDLTEGVAGLDKVAVVGAGIMGGGIAYQSAYKGKSVVMKDIAQAGLDQGMEEASKLLAKRVSRGRMSAEAMAETLSAITPSLHYADFDSVDIAVEAVVENLKVKHAVLQEVQANTRPGTVIASNTSTISIDKMAAALDAPENFLGMHFFNPVHRMPLVEVIRGSQTSDAAVAKTVKLAKDMGKTPIVVNDCPGFYVNRVLFPYLAGFNILITEGADFVAVDKVMEKFGWPMGPAYLVDVVGIDTACHAAAVMAEGFPTRMLFDGNSPVDLLHAQNRLGQKNDLGFYKYVLDRKGKQQKQLDESVGQIIAPAVKGSANFDDETIIERLMLPMCFEVVRCLDENIVAEAVDADIGLLMGLGFPLFRGGPIAYMENVGLQNIVEAAKKYAHLGELYQPPALLLDKVANNQSFYA